MYTPLNRRFFVGFSALVVAGALLYWGFFMSHGPNVQVLEVHRAPFVEQILVSGQVRAAKAVDLGFAQSGRVSGVYADVGDEVREGTLLAQTENGDLRAALATAEAELSSIEEGTRPEQIAVTQAQIDSDETALSQADASVLNAIQNGYIQSDNAVHNVIDQFFNNPRSAAPTLTFSTSDSQIKTSLETSRSGIEKMLAEWKNTVSTIVPTDDMSEIVMQAQEHLADTAQILAEANNALNVALTSSTVTQSSLNTYITNVGAARATINAAQTTLTSALTAQKAALATLVKDKKNLALEQAGGTESDIRAQRAWVEAARANFNQTLVVAPFDGTVTKMDAKVGEVISPSVSEISMISSGFFQIEAFVPEVEITGLSVGDMATTTLDAYGPAEFFSARVIAIDPAETVVNGVSTYKVTLQFLQQDDRIKSGMTASLTITARTEEDAIAIPKGAIYLENGLEVVQLLRDEQISVARVKTRGIGGIGNVEIIDGLSEGDLVVLNPSLH